MIFSSAQKLIWGSMLLAGGVALAAKDVNLLVNAGFEEVLEPVWEQRTPADAQRKLYREEGTGRSGAALVLENVVPAYTRLRQGQDRSITPAPGSLIELSAWIKSEQGSNGVATIQLYCLDNKGAILSQPAAPQISGSCDWRRTRVMTLVPDATAYVMAYLQISGGTGRVWFDDVVLKVKLAPLPRKPMPRIALLTDLSQTNAIIQRAKVLFEDGLVMTEPSLAADALKGAAGALVLYEGAAPAGVWPALDGFARSGGRVFMDIRAFAASHGTAAVAVAIGDVKGKSLEARMDAGLRVVQASEATAGFAIGETMPRTGWPDGELFVLPAGFALPGLEILAVAPGNEAGLVRLALGKGAITACDLLSLREPHCRNVDAYYAFTPVSASLGNPVRFGKYYPRKLSYDGVIAEMQRLAATYPAISIKEEGPASEGHSLWSLNLGKPGAPLYFLYAAAHGSEWEPGYGLMTLAQRLAEGALADVIDLQKVQIKIIPLLNPSGYEKVRRQNAQGVDLNRQGDYHWEQYKGRDSNNDGQWGLGDYDWKGTAPLDEPEARVYHKIISQPNVYCLLDLHGNTSAKNNKLGILPFAAHPDNEMMALNLQQIANERLRGRHLLRQNDEDEVSQYLLDRIYFGSARPVLMNSGARDKFGLTIEVTAGYGNSYGTVLQTDVTCELCRALFIAYPAPAESSWPMFRGAQGDGTAKGADLPLKWSETENVRWKTAMPNHGWSTPVVQGNRIWLTSATEKGEEFFALCVDAESGKILIEKQLFHTSAPEPLGNSVNGYASPSPAIEPGRVYLHFGSYGTACLNAESGELIWKRDDLPCRHYRGPGSSPILYKDLLILTFDGVDQQYLTALNKHSGKSVWTTKREIEWQDLDDQGQPKREGDFRKGFTTPLVIDVKGQPQLISPASNVLFAYDPDSGKEIWRTQSNAHTPVVIPVYAEGLVLAVTGHGAAEMLAIRPDGKGDVTDSHVVWRIKGKDVPDTPSPVVVNGLLYMLSDHGVLNCIEIKTGAQLWRETLRNSYIASPIHTGERIYLFSVSGKTTVIHAGRTFEKLAENNLDAGFMASPAVAGDALILRTKTHLYCIGK